MFLDNSCAAPLAVKPALLIGYTCFLRASNLLSPNISTWGGPHTLRAGDIVPSKNGLYVFIRSSKTLSGGRPTVLEVWAVPGSPLCPVSAWFAYKRVICPSPRGPAFLLNNGAPLTALPVIKIIRLALKQAGVSYASEISMHSLRRGAAQAAECGGAPVSDIMAQGTWASPSGVSSYLKPKTVVPRLMASVLAV